MHDLADCKHLAERPMGKVAWCVTCGAIRLSHTTWIKPSVASEATGLREQLHRDGAFRNTCKCSDCAALRSTDPPLRAGEGGS